MTWTDDESNDLDLVIIRDRLYQRARTIERDGADARRYVGDPYDRDAIQETATAIALHERGHTYEDIGTMLSVNPGTLRERAGRYYAWRDEYVLRGTKLSRAKRRPELTCEHCGKSFRSDRTRKMCSSACVAARARERHVSMARSCSVCGAPVRGQRTTCSDACRDATRARGRRVIKKCQVCDSDIPVELGRHRTTCSDQCKHDTYVQGGRSGAIKTNEAK